MKKVGLLLFCLSALWASAQRIPVNIAEAMQILQDSIPDSVKIQDAAKTEKEITEVFDDWNTPQHRLFYSWIDADNETAYQKYFSGNGVRNLGNQMEMTSLCWQRTLKKSDLQLQALFGRYRQVEEKWAAEDKVRFTTDSLRGVYIPKDLEDCFRQIDSFWDDSTKKEVKKMNEYEFAGMCHMGFGMWMRNNWGLWAGSRLSKYFHDAGVHHPDEMSGIILRNYHRHLCGKKPDKEWMKK